MRYKKKKKKKKYCAVAGWIYFICPSGDKCGTNGNEYASSAQIQTLKSVQKSPMTEGEGDEVEWRQSLTCDIVGSYMGRVYVFVFKTGASI